MRAVNLIPAEQRTGAELGVGRSQGGAYAVLVVIAGLALMVVLYGKADHAISTKSAQAASLTQKAQIAETLASRLAPYTSFVAMREQREQAVETLLESRFDWAHVFHEFGRVLPLGTSVSSLDGTVGAKVAAVGSKAPIGSAAPAAGSVASSTPPGSVPTFTISGCAVGQPEVAELLERLRLIDGVSEVSLHELHLVHHRRRRRRHRWLSPARPVLHGAGHIRSVARHLGGGRRHGAHENRGGLQRRVREHEGRHLGGERKMSGRDRTVMIVAVVVVVLGLAWFALVSPERKKASKLDAQITSAQAQLASAEGKLQNARGAQARYSAAYASVINLGKAVPPTQEVPSLIYQVTQAANEKNVDFAAISTTVTGSSGAASSASSAAASSFSELPFTFTFEGGFFQLEHLFRGLDDFATLASPGHINVSGRLLTVQSVKLAPAVGAGTTGSGELSGTVTASAYVLPASEGLTGAASPASPSASGTSAASGSSASSPTTPAIVKATAP